MRLLVVTLALALFAALVGATAGAVATAHHEPLSAPLFSGVPEGGFPDPFPYGQCTWWAAYNRRVGWGGNARDWLVNARAQGATTSEDPSVGAIVVYRPGGDYSAYGHVALVVAVSAHSYTVSEMNAPRWGQVTTRIVPRPDHSVQGFIPLRADETPATSIGRSRAN